MGKIGQFVNRLLKRGETAGTTVRSGPVAGGCPPGDPVKCLGGKLYRMRLRDGRWETYGPPLGDCDEDD